MNWRGSCHPDIGSPSPHAAQDSGNKGPGQASGDSELSLASGGDADAGIQGQFYKGEHQGGDNGSHYVGRYGSPTMFDASVPYFPKASSYLTECIPEAMAQKFETGNDSHKDTQK